MASTLFAKTVKKRLIDLVEHLEGRVEFLLSQIEKKDRRMDEKDEIIRKLMEKVL